MVPQVLEDGDTGARREEPQDVARGEDEVERFGDAQSRQVEQGEVTDQPGGVGEVRRGVGDEGGIDVDTDHGVAGPGQAATDATRTTSVSYTHLRAHETRHDLVCRLLLEKKKKKN